MEKKDLRIKALKSIDDTVFYPPEGQSRLRSMIETIEIAILGTLIAVTLSVPVGLFSARNIAPNFLRLSTTWVL